MAQAYISAGVKLTYQFSGISTNRIPVPTVRRLTFSALKITMKKNKEGLGMWIRQKQESSSRNFVRKRK